MRSIDVPGSNINLIAPHQAPGLFAGVPALPPHLVGRDDLLADLAGQFITGQSHYLALHGLPGVGKTALAIALVYHRQLLDHFQDGVLWGSLGPPPQADPMRVLAAWADALGRDISDVPDPRGRRDAVQALIGRRRLLLVIDDAWSTDDAQLLRCGGPHCCHLLTTRRHDIARAFAGDRANAIGTLDDDPAYTLLAQLAPEACRADPAAARELAVAVGGLPLALELLGGYLAAPEHSYFPELSAAALAELTDPKRRLALACERLGAGGGQLSLQETIALSLEGLSHGVVTAFHALGAFAARPERFDREAAQAVAQTAAAVLALLAARNLLEMEGESLALHQVLADFTRAHLDDYAVIRHRRHYLNLVNQDRHAWSRIEAAYGQVKWAWQHTPADASRLDWIWALATYHTRRGLWRDELEWLEESLRIAKTHELRRDEGTLLNNIGAVYDHLGQREKALDYYGRALPIREQVGDRPGLATTLNNIGAVYARLGQREKALDYYRRALPIKEEVGDRYGESATRYNIAMIHRAQGQLTEAVVQLQRVVELDRLTQNPDLESHQAMLAQVEAELAKTQKKKGLRRLLGR